MSDMHSEPVPGITDVLRQLVSLPHEVSRPAEFWPRYLDCLRKLIPADQVVLLARGNGEGVSWTRMASAPATLLPNQTRTQFTSALGSLADVAVNHEQFVQPLDSTSAWVGGIRLDLSRPEDQSVLLCLFAAPQEAAAREKLVRLKLAEAPLREFLSAQSLRQARDDVERASVALDITLQVNAEKHFLAAALALCNSIASRHGCQRVSLGWSEHERVRLVAVSRMEKFDRQMEAARALEMAMEEALDQDDEVVWPAPEGSTVIARDHAAFAKSQEVDHVASVPLRLEAPVAVLTCERQDLAFEAEELKAIRLYGDAVARRLVDLKRTDRWFGPRLLAASRERLASLLGPERTWLKALAVVLTLLLGILVFGRFPYRVEGEFLLRSEKVAYLSAPFDGYIEEVFVRPGDTLESGEPILNLRTSELELQESAARADYERYLREAEKARASDALAEMRVAQALSAQARAQLDLVRYRMEQAVVRAPFDGVVVEGDLRDRLGAPVKQAEVMIKLARLDSLYVEAKVNERDIHEIQEGDSGEIAFVSQPKLKYPIRVVTVEQAAVPQENANMFLLQCEVDGAPHTWWRPGMSGLCKIDVEKRSLLWIVTHRTVDFVRMKLWW